MADSTTGIEVLYAQVTASIYTAQRLLDDTIAAYKKLEKMETEIAQVADLGEPEAAIARRGADFARGAIIVLEHLAEGKVDHG